MFSNYRRFIRMEHAGSWFMRTPSSLRAEDYRFYFFMSLMYILAVLLHTVLLFPLYFMLDNRITFVSDALCIPVDILCFILLRMGRINVSLLLFVTAISAHTSLAIIVFGGSSSLSMFFISMYALVFFSHWKMLYKILSGIVILFITVGLSIYTLYAEPLTPLGQVQMVYWNCSNIILNFFIVGYGIYYFSLIVNSTEKKLKYDAEHDVLTGVLNRNAIMRVLISNIVRRQTGMVSVVMCDIDHFKVVNDTYGHLTGDEVLKSISRIIGTGLRDVDSLGRFGGEEFIIVLPGCQLSSALGVAERIRRLIESATISTASGDLKITVSLGVSTLWSGKEEDAGRLIESADIALYKAKNAGRNRVEYT